MFAAQSKINRIQNYLTTFDTLVSKYIQNPKRIKKSISVVVCLSFIFTLTISISYWLFLVIISWKKKKKNER